ncbi:MAG: site-2 protease family protein [Phycisphaerales bacterium]|nr:site-2 protease family protein [Phycisphaerales bacterium]
MNFFNASFRIGSLLGIEIRVHALMVIFVVFQLVQSHDIRFDLAFYGMLFGIILVHEFGHCLGARSVGGDARHILMWPLGGLAFAHAPMTPWAQFVTVACGPLVNVVFCIVAAASMVAAVASSGYYADSGLWEIVSNTIWLNPLHPSVSMAVPALWYKALMIFYGVNLLLLAFNLLPIYPLDGGQLFFTIIWPFVGIHRATEIACYVGLGGAILLGYLGLSSGGGGSMLIFIAIFGGFTCWQRLQALRYGMIVDERIGSYDWVARNKPPRRKKRWFWQRDRKPANENPNPGGWERKVSEHQRLDQEVDEILKKVSQRGLHSLTYAERSKLERASRDRRQAEREERSQ